MTVILVWLHAVGATSAALLGDGAITSVGRALRERSRWAIGAYLVAAALYAFAASAMAWVLLALPVVFPGAPS